MKDSNETLEIVARAIHKAHNYDNWQECAQAAIDAYTEATKPKWDDLERESAAMEEKLDQIESWCEAYPLSIFPEPDWKKARAALEMAGMTLDSVSASNMRHVVEGVKRIIKRPENDND